MISTKHRAKTLKGLRGVCERKLAAALRMQNIAEANTWLLLLDTIKDYISRDLPDGALVDEISCIAFTEALDLDSDYLVWRLQAELLFQMFQNRGENLLDYNQWMHDTAEIEPRAAFITKYLDANKAYAWEG